jgi:hypothetical protein
MLVSSRSFDEYVAMFGLDDAALAGSVLDCCAGGSSFVADLAARGGTGLAVDPVYARGADEIRRAVAASRDAGNTIVGAGGDDFVWDWYGSPERRDRMRVAAADRFLADRVRRPAGYVAGALPRLPLTDRSHDLVLCSHLLFTWADRLDAGWHRAALAELARVARREVRIFPLVVQGAGAAVPFLARLIDGLRADGHHAAVRAVPYEFQRGADRMLVLTPAGSPG